MKNKELIGSECAYCNNKVDDYTDRHGDNELDIFKEFEMCLKCYTKNVTSADENWSRVAFL